LQEILKYLKDRGERLDSEIATDTGISLENVRLHVSALSARGEVMLCQSIRFNNGKRSEGLLCRIAGYIPPAAPGRKSKAHLKAQTQTEEEPGTARPEPVSAGRRTRRSSPAGFAACARATRRSSP